MQPLLNQPFLSIGYPRVAHFRQSHVNGDAVIVTVTFTGRQVSRRIELVHRFQAICRLLLAVVSLRMWPTQGDIHRKTSKNIIPNKGIANNRPLLGMVYYWVNTISTPGSTHPVVGIDPGPWLCLDVATRWWQSEFLVGQNSNQTCWIVLVMLSSNQDYNDQWIGLRDNLQENLIFNRTIDGFL